MIGTLLLASLLTIDGIVAQHPIDGDVPRAFSWAPDGSAYVYSVPGKNEGDPPLVRLYDVRTRNDRPLLRAASEQRGSRSRDIAQIVWSNDSRHVAIVNAGALGSSIRPTARAERLQKTPTIRNGRPTTAASRTCIAAISTQLTLKRSSPGA